MRLTRRRYPHSSPEEVPGTAWRFARLQGGGGDLRSQAVAVVPSRSDLYVDGGLRPGWIYELTYEAEAPLVLGLGLVAVRDLVSHLRHDPAQPLGELNYAYGWGRSQTGRAIRDFIHRGFNEDTEGRRVFDGLLPHVSGAGRLDTGRFANPDGAGRPAVRGSPQRGRRRSRSRTPRRSTTSPEPADAIMKRASDPKVLHTQTSTEYWQRR
ncbi:alpha/beta hydrolase domain-containing protein [Streptomyces sp. L7]